MQQHHRGRAGHAIDDVEVDEVSIGRLAALATHGHVDGGARPHAEERLRVRPREAARGNEVYLMQCKSCHTPASHTGVVFANSWHGKPLSELYTYIVERMPKNEPGSLQPYEYADVLAYLLKLNEMPA